MAGVIQVARFSSVDALRGEGMELQAVAVTVIGGTLLSGGYGSVIGTILGAITFGMIQVGLVLAGAPGHFFKTLTGTHRGRGGDPQHRCGAAMARSKPLARLSAEQRGRRCGDAWRRSMEQRVRDGAVDWSRRTVSPTPGRPPAAAPATCRQAAPSDRAGRRRTPCR